LPLRYIVKIADRIKEAMSATVIEMLSGILRFFPNILIASLFVIGILTGRMAWILVSIGGLVIAIITLTLQYVMTKTIGIGDIPGRHVMDACSLIPVTQDSIYNNVPSLWISLTSFFLTFIFMNGLNIYSQAPVRTNDNSTSVQQRKGVGMISMVAVLILFVFLIMSRCTLSIWNFRMDAPTCESLLGVITGLAVGLGGGYLWWMLLDACGPEVYPDIHGVMIGTQPGLLHSNPIACA